MLGFVENIKKILLVMHIIKMIHVKLVIVILFNIFVFFVIVSILHNFILSVKLRESLGRNVNKRLIRL